jgi:hypothetical protein
MSKDEQRELENKLYSAICSVLQKYERKGYNSHARTQEITKTIVARMNVWIALQDMPAQTLY